jgi:hypothetical protein
MLSSNAVRLRVLQEDYLYVLEPDDALMYSAPISDFEVKTSEHPLKPIEG